MTNPTELVKIILDELNIKELVQKVSGMSQEFEVHSDGKYSWLVINGKNVGEQELANKILMGSLFKGTQ